LRQRDWKDAHVTICYGADDEHAREQERSIKDLIENSRFQIGALRYRRFSFDAEKGIFRLIMENSRDDDLVFLGISETMEVTEYMPPWSDLHVDAGFMRSNGDAGLSACFFFIISPTKWLIPRKTAGYLGYEKTVIINQYFYLRRGQTEPERSVMVPEQMFGGMRVLLVESDPALRAYFHDALTRDALTVSAVSSGAAGFDALRSQGFDALIVDHRLSDMTGLRFLEKIRTGFPRVAHIVYIANGEDASFVEAHRFGADVCLLRPFVSRTLRAEHGRAAL
jgi:CheY-like chemotaxis protein